MPRRLRLLLAAALAISAISTASPGEAGELGVEDVDPIDLEFMIMRGQVDEAIEEANRMLAGLRPSEDPLVLYRIGQVLIRLCEARGELGQYKQAEAACLESVATVDQIRAPGLLEKWAMAEAQAMLAYTYERARKPRAAIDARRRQLALTEDGPETADHRSRLLRNIADLQLAIGERKQAELSYREALALTSQVPEKDRLWALVAYRSLAEFYWMEERFDEAEAILNAGLAEVERLPGKRDWQTIRFSEALGWTYFLQGRYPEARVAAGSALNHYQRKGYDRSLDSAQANILLARVEDAEAPGSREAARLLVGVLQMPDEEDHPASIMKAIARTLLAAHHLMNGSLAEAELLAREAAAAIGQSFGDVHIALAPAYKTIALALQGQGKLSEAVAFAQKAYAAEQRVYPPYHSETGETLALLAELYEALGQRENLVAIEELTVAYRVERNKFEQAN